VYYINTVVYAKQGAKHVNYTVVTHIEAFTSCFCVRRSLPRICAAERLCGCTWSPGVSRSGPSAPGARGRRAARRPWRPWRPQRRACRETARRRTRGSPWCTCPGGCTRLQRGRTSRKLGAESPEKFGKSGCPLSGRSSPPRLAAPFRSSCSQQTRRSQTPLSTDLWVERLPQVN